MKNKGNMVVSCIFVILTAFMGISLLTFTALHTRIVGARTFKLAETDKMYQNLIYYLHHFKEKIFSQEIRAFSAPETEYFNPVNFPDIMLKNEHNITHSFAFYEVPKIDYKKTRITVGIDISSLPTARNKYCISSKVFIDILSGKIPLAAIPFFLNQENPNPGVETATFLKENKITNNSDKEVVIDEIEVEIGSGKFLLDALKVTGNNLGWREIRDKFGLPPSDEPIPDGVYLLEAEGVVESCFVQGNVEQLVFSTWNDRQVIRLVRDSVSYELRYKPKEKDFECWDAAIERDVLYKERIIVNGSILAMEQEGDGAFVREANIKILVSGTAVIRSNLQTVNPQFNVGKTNISNLKLTCGKKDAGEWFGQEGTASEVVVDNVNNTDIQASIIAEGKFTNNAPGLKLSGSLFCKEIENNGSIEINHKNPGAEEENYFRTTDFKYIDLFLISFIEEVSDDNDK